MTRPELSAEFEAHQVLKRFKRSKVLSVYFTLKDEQLPDDMNVEEAELFAIPMEFFESYFRLGLRDDLVTRVVNFTV